MFKWMKNLKLKKNPTILDVGANIGIFSLSYACIFTGAEIHSFNRFLSLGILCQIYKLIPN